MRKVSCTFEFITPGFLHGSNPSSLEIRANSLKGVLRYWWRAYYFSKYFKEKDLHDFSALEEKEKKDFLKSLKEEEGRFFGTSLKDNPSKCPFNILITDSTGLTKSNSNSFHRKYAGNNLLYYKIIRPEDLSLRVGYTRHIPINVLSRVCMVIMAFLMMSAALPWMGALMAVRIPNSRC